jgi:hypothetical protein
MYLRIAKNITDHYDNICNIVSENININIDANTNNTHININNHKSTRNPIAKNDILPEEAVIESRYGLHAYITDIYPGYVWKMGSWYKITDSTNFNDELNFPPIHKDAKLKCPLKYIHTHPLRMANPYVWTDLITSEYICVKINGRRAFVTNRYIYNPVQKTQTVFDNARKEVPINMLQYHIFIEKHRFEETVWRVPINELMELINKMDVPDFTRPLKKYGNGVYAGTIQEPYCDIAVWKCGKWYAIKETAMFNNISFPTTEYNLDKLIGKKIITTIRNNTQVVNSIDNKLPIIPLNIDTFFIPDLPNNTRYNSDNPNKIYIGNCAVSWGGISLIKPLQGKYIGECIRNECNYNNNTINIIGKYNGVVPLNHIVLEFFLYYKGPTYSDYSKDSSAPINNKSLTLSIDNNKPIIDLHVNMI